MKTLPRSILIFALLTLMWYAWEIVFQMVNWLHIISGIPAILVVCLVCYLISRIFAPAPPKRVAVPVRSTLVRRAPMARSTAARKPVRPAKPGWMAPIGFGMGFFVLFLVVEFLVAAVLINTPLHTSAVDAELVQYYKDLDLMTRSGTPDAYLTAAEDVKNKMNEDIPESRKTVLAEKALDLQLKAADLLATNGQHTDREREILEAALQWAKDKKLTKRVTEIELRIGRAKPTAVPTPTLTPTPVPTPLPTRVPPTPVPTPIIKPGESNPCVIPQQFTKVDQVLLHPAVRQEPSGRIPEEFGHASKNVEIVGDELAICISSTPDGKGAPQVDDQVEFDVYMGSTHIGGFPMPFYDPRTKGIKEWPSQKAQWLFPTKGTYRVNTVLTDLIGNVRSSTDLWLVIWR